MKRFRLTLRVKINIAILLTFIIIASIYAAVFFPFEIKRQQTVIEQVKLTLKEILRQRQDLLGDELFGRQLQALKITTNELLKVKGIVAIRLYLNDGTLFHQNGRKIKQHLSLEQLQKLTPKPVFKRYIDSNLPLLNFSLRIDIFGEKIGFIEVDYDLSRVEEEAYLSKIMNMAMLFVILLAMFGLLNILLSKMVLKPIYTFSETIKKIQHGAVGEQVHLSTQDEMGEMALVFNQMSKELAELTQGLEQRVADRTNQLKETNKELEKARALAESSTAMKSEFLANMSHEIRSPMNAIIGLSHLALKLELSSKLKDYLVKIDASSKALLGIINDILDFSKIEAGKLSIEKTSFKLEDVLDNLRNMIALKAEEKDLELIFYTAKGVPNYLLGDPLRLGQVLLNLSTNAIKFTESGHVLIKIENQESDKKNISYLSFSVIDTGIGLSKKQIDKLFQSFSQADTSTTRKYGGTGLGLAICKNIIELMQGQIKLESRQGKGSTFSFSLPFEIDKSNQSLVPANFSTHTFEGTKVLVIDDNAIAREIVVEHLQPYHFNLSQVASGEESIAELENAALAKTPYQLLLMDWKMPGKNGIDTFIQIKENLSIRPTPKIIMITSYGYEEILVKAEKVGIDDYLVKPVEQRMLLNKVAMVLTGKHKEQQQLKPINKAEQPDKLSSIRGARALLVEDNEINQQVAKEMLNYAGIEVEIANNGLEAVNRIINEADAGYFDIIFMDIQMPVMDGHSATQKIRNSTAPLRQIPIIAMTAHAMESERQKCLDNGMNEHVSKPIEPERLAEALIQWIKPKPDQISVKTPLTKAPSNGSNEISQDVTLLPKTLDGFDLAAGLSRLAGKRQLYFELLVKFSDKHQKTPQQIEQLFAQQKYEEGSHLAHAIKGNAGNLGANKLYQAAAELELAFAQKQKIESAIEKFNQQLHFVLKTLSVLQEESDQLNTDTPTESLDLDIDKINAELKQLEQLISNDYGEALESIERLKLLTKGNELSDKIAKLVNYLDAFDEQAAKKELESILHLPMILKNLH